MTAQRTMAVAALLVAIGIVIGASATHSLKSLLTAAQVHALETAVHYQLLNALGLFMLGLLAQSRADDWMSRIAWLLLSGILCFSGGIYLMLAGAPSLLGLVTPVGGLLMIVAWLLLAWRLWMKQSASAAD
jgi:uncharacterized membrane protein YgdD (TMEM256/DUF423 family)